MTTHNAYVGFTQKDTAFIQHMEISQWASSAPSLLSFLLGQTHIWSAPIRHHIQTHPRRSAALRADPQPHDTKTQSCSWETRGGILGTHHQSKHHFPEYHSPSTPSPGHSFLGRLIAGPLPGRHDIQIHPRGCAALRAVDSYQRICFTQSSWGSTPLRAVDS